MVSLGNYLSTSLDRGWQSFSAGAENVHDGSLRCLGVVAFGTVTIIRFIKENWDKLIAHALAWGVIVCCSGFSHGFSAVALPLSIGLGAGTAFGIILGILLTNSCDPKGEWTPWNRLNGLIDRLPPNGTRQVVLAVAVSVLLTVSAVYPYILGGVFGAFIGNQLATKIILGQRMGTHEKTEMEKLQDEVKAQAKMLSALKQQIEILNARALGSNPPRTDGQQIPE